MNKEKIWTDKAVKAFLVLVIVLSLTVEIIYILKGTSILMLVLMWMPALASLIANIISLKEKKEKLTVKEFLNRLGFRSSKLIYILLGIFIPLVYLLIPYLIYWQIYPDNFAYHGVALNLILKDIMPAMTLGIFFSLVSALGEELGWRGFMVPALRERIGLKKTLFVTSIFWCCWHLPLLIWGGYMDQCPLWYRLPAFILCVMPIGIICGLLTVESDSVWPAAFLHAAHNNYDQSVFGLISRGEKLMYYVSETGFLTIICAWIIAIIMYISYAKRHQGTL